MSFISKLQNYCQEHRLDIPLYTSNYLSGPSHQPIYEVTCAWQGLTNSIQFSNIKKGKEQLAEIYLNQVLAYQLVSPNNNIIELNQKIIPEIKQKNSSMNIKQSIIIINDHLKNNNYSGIVFVDHENVNINIQEIHKKYYYILVSSKNCTKIPINEYNTYNVKCSFVGKDVADTLLIYLAGKLNIDDKHVFIFTKDHYGDSLARILDGYHVCNIEEIKNIIY